MVLHRLSMRHGVSQEEIVCSKPEVFCDWNMHNWIIICCYTSGGPLGFRFVRLISLDIAFPSVASRQLACVTALSDSVVKFWWRSWTVLLGSVKNGINNPSHTWCFISCEWDTLAFKACIVFGRCYVVIGIRKNIPSWWDAGQKGEGLWLWGCADADWIPLLSRVSSFSQVSLHFPNPPRLFLSLCVIYYFCLEGAFVWSL